MRFKFYMPLTKSLKIACCEIGEMHECVSNFVESKGVYFYLFKSNKCVSKNLLITKDKLSIFRTIKIVRSPKT